MVLQFQSQSRQKKIILKAETFRTTFLRHTTLTRGVRIPSSGNLPGVNTIAKTVWWMECGVLQELCDVFCMCVVLSKLENILMVPG